MNAANWTLSVADLGFMTAQINRVTGGIELRFFKLYDAKDEAACRAARNGPWCAEPPLIATIEGKCHPVSRRF